jgi:hypothetical protein
MSSKNGTTSTSSGGSYGGDRYDSSEQRTEAKKSIAKVAVNTAVQREREKGNELYGGAASQAAKDSLVDQGLAKVGSYFVQQGGEFVRVSKDQYDAAKAAGQKVSTSITGQRLEETLYGQSDIKAMGTGDPTGVLSSTAISQKMFERQRNIKLAIAGGFAMAGIPGIPSAMLYDSMRTDYEGYLDRFNKNMTSTSIAASSNRTTDSGAGSTSGVTNDATITNQNQDAVLEKELRENRYAALTGSGGIDAERRALLATSTRTITGSMV